eukprot:NODE_772_length_4378_cov_0.184623.p3 type:complete len:101 gc:universal NODE_772_length_4378_cov_0.184623:974-672(-)
MEPVSALLRSSRIVKKAGRADGIVPLNWLLLKSNVVNVRGKVGIEPVSLLLYNRRVVNPGGKLVGIDPVIWFIFKFNMRRPLGNAVPFIIPFKPRLCHMT